MDLIEARERATAALRLLGAIQRIQWQPKDCKFLFAKAAELEAEVKLLMTEVEALQRA